MENPAQKSVLITGCSSGIGYDAAHGLRAAGWRVFASCRQEADCARLRAEGFEAPQLDLASPDSIRAALNEVLTATGGTLDALYNNGAFACPGAVEDLPAGALRDVYETNVFGTHDLTRAVIPVMRAQGHGRIVMCSSILGYVPAPWRGAYVSSKFALEGLTDVLRLEMRDTPIHIITIAPGPITSKIRQNAQKPFEKWVDYKSSPRRAQYESGLLQRLYDTSGKPDTFELPPAAVTKKLRHALEHPRPRPRYFVTVPTYLMTALRRLLPTRALDWLCAKG